MYAVTITTPHITKSLTPARNTKREALAYAARIRRMDSNHIATVTVTKDGQPI